ncbi:MAG: aromatic amino acid ammonia-lyase, partial [Cloacibacillus sp.]|nr:aromatic amino acid ammonia-lyase [Cloacibacillus sp.]
MDEVSVLVPSKIGRADKIKKVTLGPGPLSLEEFIAVVRYNAELVFSPEYIERVSASRELAEKFLAENRKIYGLTTGFGENVSRIIPQDEAVQLQVNILRSHAVSVGKPLKREAVRAVWLMQLLSLGKGYSGIRLGV